MPQLDTSTWFITVISSSLSLFTLMQLKIYPQIFSPDPKTKDINLMKTKNSWELKWTKIYLPLSLPLQ